MTEAGNKSWLAKNWAWVVPVGVLVVAAGVAAVVSPFYFGTAAAIRKTSAYKQAIMRVARNPQVRRQLGDPLKAGSGVEGNLQITGQRGFADFTIPVTGPKGSGTINVEALLVGGTWQYQHLALLVDGSSKEIVVEGVQPELDLQPKTDDPGPETPAPGQVPDIPTGQSPPPDSDPSKSEPSKTVPPKTEPASSEPPEAESPKSEPSKPEAPKEEPPKTESPETEESDKKESPAPEDSKDSP